MEVGFKIEDGLLIKYEGTDAVVSIPEGVTEIGEGAFRESKTLTELIMPDSVLSIGKYAFQKCAKLKSIIFSKQLETIDYEAFVGCKALKEIELPKTLKTVGSGAFAGCVKLAKASCESEVYEVGSNPFSSFQEAECKLMFDKNGFLVFANVLFQYNGNADVITVPDGVTHIAYGALKSGSYSWEKILDVKKIILPNSIKHVGRYAFANCAKLKEVIMPDGVEFEEHAFSGCPKMADDNGFIIIGNKVHEYLGKDTVVTIPDGIEVLADNLFSTSDYDSNSANKNIVKIVLPESLKHIGNCTFRGCSALKEINIPNGVKKIDAGAFYDCTSLVKIEIPESTQVFNQAFNNCTGLADENGFIIINNFLFQYIGSANEVVVPENVKLIGSGAFSKLRIKKITLPKGLVGLGSAFSGCEWLEEIEIPDGITAIQANTFNGCLALKKVALPDAITAIGNGAFAKCETLGEVNIPNGVTQIGDSAFEGCKALKAIAFPSGTKNVQSYVCQNCESLESVVLSDGVEIIEHTSFEGCTSLKQITLPASVQKIGYSAFKNCLQLETLEIQNKECDIDLSSFANCPKLIDENGMKIIAGVLVEYTGEGGSVTIPDTVHTLAPNVFREGHDYSRRSYVNYRQEGSLYEITIPSSVKKICSWAFKGCKKLNKVTFNDGVESIGNEAFAECELLNKIVLPSTVKTLGVEAFAECKSLTSITIPANLEAINLDVFKSCEKLANIFVEAGNKKYADIDGILYNAEKNTLVYCPAGKKLKEFVFAEHVNSVADHAFIDCLSLKKVFIPASVKKIGNSVFARNGWSDNAKLKDIQVAIGAGSEFVGEAAIDFPYGDAPLVYPTIPVLFPKEQTVQVRLGLGFCQSPEKYSGEYAEGYRKYVESHQKTLLKKAAQLRLQTVEDYFSSNSGDKAESDVGYKPNLTLKKPNELQKVEILEEVVRKGTLEDLKAVLNTYKTFEMTARALGLASRYRGVDFVRTLAEHGATFIYKSESSLQRKYTMDQKTAAGSYSTEYYLMAVPEKLDFAEKYGTYAYDYTPMYGVTHIGISDELEATKLPLKDRLEVVRYYSENKKLGVSLDEMLFWALTRDELDFADALIAMGVNLQKTPPTYYPSWGVVPTYLDVVTSGSQTVYWTSYLSQMTSLKAEQVLAVFERLNALAKSADKKLILTQKFFDELDWNDALLSFALDNIDFSKVNQKKALEAAVSKNGVSSLAKMADAGWISQPTKREKLIEFARENKKKEALAWLMDYKNRTADVAAEEAKAEAKMIKELTEDPNSVSALKKVWGYKKMDDGSLVITSYKGNATEVVIPSVIGKAPVTKIAEDAFSASDWNGRIKNREERKKIVSVVIPEGVTEIEKSAFWNCDELAKIVLPTSLKKVGTAFAGDCKSLKEVNISSNVKITGDGVLFWRCNAMHDESGCIIASGRLLGHTEHNGWSHGIGIKTSIGNITIPDGVVEIVNNVFDDARMDSITFPETLKTIGENAFKKCTFITDLEIPASVETIKAGAFRECSALKTVKIKNGTVAIGAEAFNGCRSLREVYIPKSVSKIGKEIFGQYDENASWYKVSGICVHTQEGAPIVEYLSKYSGIYVEYDYQE